MTGDTSQTESGTEPTAGHGPVDRPVRRPVGQRADGQHYADKAPPGCYLLDDETPAAVGDMAYIGLIGGRWVQVRRGMNIAGATLDELLGWGSALSLARMKTPNVEIEPPRSGRLE